MSAVQVLKNATLVDRRSLSKLSAEEMNAQLSMAYGVGDVRIVDDSVKFANNDSVRAAIATDSSDLPLILELRGIELDDSEKFIITQNVKLMAKINDILNYSPPAPAVSYQFYKIPKGWTIDKLRFTSQTIGRGKGGYTIGRKTLEKVWGVAGPYWAKQAKRSLVSIRAGGRDRTAMISSKGIKIGCQFIQRHEIEQVALHLGWAMPDQA